MDAADVLTKLYERANALQAFWGFYISVAIGLVAFFGAAKQQRPVSLAAIFTTAFVGFAIVNGLGIHDIATQRWVLFQMLSEPTMQASLGAISATPKLKVLFDHLLAASEPPQPSGYVIFHVFADVMVLVAIWYLTLGGTVFSGKRAGGAHRPAASR